MVLLLRNMLNKWNGHVPLPSQAGSLQGFGTSHTAGTARSFGLLLLRWPQSHICMLLLPCLPCFAVLMCRHDCTIVAPVCVPAEDAAVLGWHVQQQGLCEAALRAFEVERIPRVKEVFALTDKHAAKMKAGGWPGLRVPVDTRLA